MRKASAALVALALAASTASAALTPAQQEEAQALIAQFAAPEFEIRQQAVQKLIAMGPDVLPLVRTELARTLVLRSEALLRRVANDAEVKLRCEMVVKGVSANRKLVEKRVKPFDRTGWKLSPDHVAVSPDGA